MAIMAGRAFLLPGLLAALAAGAADNVETHTNAAEIVIDYSDDATQSKTGGCGFGRTSSENAHGSMPRPISVSRWGAVFPSNRNQKSAQVAKTVAEINSACKCNVKKANTPRAVMTNFTGFVCFMSGEYLRNMTCA